MALPPELRAGIERELKHVERARLAQASAEISSTYREGRFPQSLASAEAQAAYLLTRLPATFSANLRVFSEIRRLVPNLSPESLLDLGAGPGTAMWAAREVWPEIAQFTLLEANQSLLRLGERLSAGLRAQWRLADLASAELPAHDVVVLSYALGEMKVPVEITRKAWSAARKTLVIVEPGTPKNFARVAEVRRLLIEVGGHSIAPCPHLDECPMAQGGDWCHFAIRVERSAEHRRLKGGVLGYEDEKFSYLAFSKQAAPDAASRIVRHPEIHGGHIRLSLCTPAGLQSTTVTKSQKEAFRAARKAAWGDEWNP